MALSWINLKCFRNASEQRSILEWGALNGKLHKVLKSMKKYPKGSHPPTFDPAFVADAAKLANGFLVTSNTDHGYVDFSRRLTICKENKDVNEILLNYATSIAIFKRYNDCLTSSSCLFVQDWYSQLCPKSNADPKSYGHLPDLNHQGPSVSSSSIMICAGIPRGTTMHFF